MLFDSGSSRVTIQDAPDGLTISIPVKFDSSVMILLILLFALNVAFLVSSLREQDFFAILWASVVFLSARAMLWNVRGCEKILVDSQTLKLRFEMPGMTTTSSFDLSDVDTLRTFDGVRRLFTLMMLPNQRGTIIFDYKEKKIRAFGADLAQSEAERVIQR